MGGWFFKLRVALLLSVLLVVLLYAWRDHSTRRARNEWKRTLDVAFVIVTSPGVEAHAVTELRRRVPDLSRRLAQEFTRYRASAPRPFDIAVYGPTALAAPPPEPGEGLLDAARYAYRLHRFSSDLDDRAGVPSRAFDSRIYVLLSPPTDRALVEGTSEHGGRVGFARAELDGESVDLALFVAAHELFHTLGALDHYGPDGRALVPDGLAEPDLEPRYPQRLVELMARDRPLSEAEETRLSTLDELGVGPATAREIGWVGAR